jgi:hypothetical protein
MFSYTSHEKYPERSANCDYDIFEELKDGSTVLLASVFGMENAERWLRELDGISSNNFFALKHKDQTEPPIRLRKSHAAKA